MIISVQSKILKVNQLTKKIEHYVIEVLALVSFQAIAVDILFVGAQKYATIFVFLRFRFCICALRTHQHTTTHTLTGRHWAESNACAEHSTSCQAEVSVFHFVCPSVRDLSPQKSQPPESLRPFASIRSHPPMPGTHFILALTVN